jgi:hypothetical protein
MLSMDPFPVRTGGDQRAERGADIAGALHGRFDLAVFHARSRAKLWWNSWM